MFSKACEYGIRASIHIARHSQNGDRASLKSVAKAIDSPVAFTAKILQLLAKKGVVRSVMGPSGGYEIAEARLGTTTLADVVEAIDGDHIYHGCGLGLKECNASKPCPVHDRFVTIRDELKSMLQNTTILQLAKSLDEGMAFLKR